MRWWVVSAVFCGVIVGAGGVVLSPVISATNCVLPGSLRSDTAQSEKIRLVFTNKREAHIFVGALGTDGRENHRKIIRPNYFWRTATQAGEAWVVRDASGNCIGIYKGNHGNVLVEDRMP